MGKIVETIQLYKETLEEIAKSKENLLSFLECSAWNFKYDFDDQVLIYAQRPDAKACATMEEWNNKLKRWISRGTKPIFVFDKNPYKQYPFKLVFDLSDTYNYNNTEYKLWTIKPEYEEFIIESLEASFGDINSKESLVQAIILATYNMVVDNIQDYFTAILNSKSHSMFENMNKDEIKNMYITTVWASVSYMVMTRCGINAKEIIQEQELEYIKYFNNKEVLTILGSSISDIAEMELREIAKIVTLIEKKKNLQNYTFAKDRNGMYYNKKIKGGNENDEQDRIHETGGLLPSKSDNEERENTNGEIFNNEIQLLEKSQELRINDINDEQKFEQTFNRDTGTVQSEGSNFDRDDDGERESNRGNESKKSNAMGRHDEQYKDDGRGNSNERTDIYLENEIFINKQLNFEEFEQKVQENYISNHLKVEIKPNFIKTKSRIQEFVLHPEIAISARNNYQITDDNLGVGTPKEKFSKNIEAIKVLKKCENENRYATKEEQEIMAQYVGWGGLTQAFEENNNSWFNEYNILKEILNEDEYKNARSSTLTAFYTPPIVIDTMYKILQNMGLKDANILEPSCRYWEFFR